MIRGLVLACPGALGPVDLMTELVGDARAAPWLDVAARWTVVPDRLYIDASWGRQTDSTRSRQFTLGTRIAF